MNDVVLASANIVAGEVLQPGATIELALARPVEPRSAQGGIRISPGELKPISVQVHNHGRLVAVDVGELPAGAYQLVVDELLDTKGQRLVDREVIPFTMSPITATIPSHLRVEHAVRLVIGDLDVQRLSFGEQGAEQHVDVVKAVDRATGEPIELAFDHRGERVDIGDLLAGVATRRAEKFGRIDETLWRRLEGADDSEMIAVLMWPPISLPPAPYDKPADKRSHEPPDGERRVADLVASATDALRIAMREARIEINDDTASPDTPFLRATATVAQIRELARNDAVGVVHLDDPSEILDLGNSITVARSDLAHNAGFDGTGVRVAVWETGPSITTNLVFADRFTATPGASDHARLTSAIIKNTEANKPHGHAPDCDLYSANTSGTDALTWAVRTQHCTVISQSFHRASEPSGSGLQADDLLKDWLALRWPYPTILQAAGNFWATDPDGIVPPSAEFVNHKGYNSMALGNHDDTAGAVAGDSVFRNPATSHGDRELPELAANGTGVSANSQTMSGTSFAAPAAAGVTALLQDVDVVLCSWPEGCRAILMAAAGRNVSGSTWWQDVLARTDASDGAGALDAYAGVAIAQQRRWRDAPATRHGWDVGTLSSAVVGSDRLATFRYHVAVPSNILLPRVKVALAWDSAVTTSGDTATASTLTVDLDLLVRDSSGVQVASAASWDNSYEVVEFSAAPGQSYEIVIRRWSGTDSLWYGVAWTVTGFFWPIPWPLELNTRFPSR
ncbi:S8 family serine peptidase [Kribbella qitaiheensis]|uniref:S8 family serine peptidase n=1 Tax=Kribbella qitaiheensis TaxID=1544730 RepID=UPI00360821BC